MDLTVREIITAVGGVFTGGAALLDKVVSVIVKDNREASPDCVFAAIIGENNDGHRFIASAYENGAVCVLAQYVPEGCSCPAILVRDTVVALGDIAEYYRSKFDIPIVGVTGSVGKTTAKEMVSSVLSRRFNVHKTYVNLNNNIGVPLTLFGLNDAHEAAVVEMGISHFGEMAQLGRMVRPRMALYTSIGYAHLEFLENLDGVLRAKTEMLEFMPDDGTVFLSGDDETLKKLNCRQRIIRFGLTSGCDVTAENISLYGEHGMSMTVLSDGRRFDARIHSFGLHLVSAALGAAAIGIRMGLTDDEIARGIAAYAPVGGRSAIEKTDKLTIINDCYNANPTSVTSSLDSLAMLSGRRVAVLGDMMELGEENEISQHRKIGSYAAKSGIDLLLTTGSLWGAAYDCAKEQETDSSVHFDTKSELISSLPDLIKPGDTVLVKASNSKRFSEIVEALCRL